MSATQPEQRDEHARPEEPDDTTGAGVEATESDEGSTFEPEEDPDAFA